VFGYSAERLAGYLTMLPLLISAYILCYLYESDRYMDAIPLAVPPVDE